MKQPEINSRRRGDALMESIYAATIKVIKNTGYGNLTFQKIARHARTSRTVLYRRWATTFDLIQEIMAYKKAIILDGQLLHKIKDTGSLRGDLLFFLSLYQNMYQQVGPEIMNAYLFEMSRNSAKILEIKTGAVEKNVAVIRKILEFAHARGEKVKEVSTYTMGLPFDLIRMEYILHKDVIDNRRLILLVDEILLPVFKEQ